MRLFALCCLAVAQYTASVGAIAQSPVSITVSPTSEDKGRVPDIFEDVSQLERVEASTTREIIRIFQRANPTHRDFELKLTSQGYEEDDSNPALRLERVLVGPAGVLLEITGLARSRNSVSAVMRRDTLQLRNSRGATSALLAFEGVTEIRDRRGGSALVVNPGDKLFLLFDKFDDYFAFSLLHANRDGRESVYFSRVDPRFEDRYDALYAVANTPRGMKDFVVEFARNDPKGRVLPVFSRLLGQMRAQNSFEGYYTAFQLLGEPRDYAGMHRTAASSEHRAVIDGIEAEKQAEVRRREEAKSAEARRQEEQQLALQRAERTRLAEQRCLETPSCLREMEERRTACVQSIQNCRGLCDRVSGSGSFGGFIANLAAAGISAVCYRGCKCDNNFGDLLAKFDDMASGNGASGRRSASTAAAAPPVVAGDASRRTAETSRRSADVNASKPTVSAPMDYVCTVYCKGPDGSRLGTAKAVDAAEAASLVDAEGHKICRAAGHQRATELRTGASQCRKK